MVSFTGVAPHAGVWIEIALIILPASHLPVAPHAGVWIEIDEECKFEIEKVVAPHAGVWIEIPSFFCKGGLPSRRSPRGSVD